MAKTFSGGVLFAAGEGVAHVGLHAIGTPMTAGAGVPRLFGVGLGGGVVVEESTQSDQRRFGLG